MKIEEKYKWRSFAELPRPTPADDTVEGLFAPGEVVVLVGNHSAGKTTMVADLAVALLSGRDKFLGQRVQHPGAVFLAAGEGYGRLAIRVLVAGLDPAQCKNIAFLDDTPHLADTNGVDEFIQSLKARKSDMKGPAALVVIDTLCMALNGAAENSNPTMAVVSKNARAIAKALECAVMLVHHSPKGDDDGVRGASALSSAADVILSLTVKPNSNTHTLTTKKQRDRDGGDVWTFESVVVEIEGATARRIANAQKVVAPVAATEGGQDEADKRAIMGFLESVGGRVKSGSIGEATGLKGKRLLRLLKQLEESGEITVERPEDPRDKRNTWYSSKTLSDIEIVEVGDMSELAA